MASVTLTSASNTNLSQTLSSENNNNKLRDASFSSYLNNAEEKFVLELAELSQNLDPIITTPQEHLYLGRKKAEDGEIDIFGAEKYFNGGVDEENPRIANKSARKYQYKKDEPIDVEPVKPKIQPGTTIHVDPMKPKIQPGTRIDVDPMKPKIQPGTPSVHSESSWNSQSALLQSVPRNPSRSKTNKVHGKSFLASLGCNCACSDKNSVDIDECVGENNANRSICSGVVDGNAISKEPIKTNLGPVDLVRINKTRSESRVKEEMHCQKIDKLGVGLNRKDCFTFPTLNSGAENLTVKMQFQEGEEGKPRKSLEVFGSPILEKGNRSLRRLTMLAWDATPTMDEIEIPTISEGIYNDAESDASSDLFEIDSFSGKANPFLLRQASDGTSSCVTPTCYAPSEASIEWSVVTASAADFSVMSDSDEQRPATNPNKMVLTTTTAKTTPGKEIQRLRPSILLGCKSHKAVRVAGDANGTNQKPIPDPRRRYRSDSFSPVTRFQAETKMTGIDSRHGQQAYASRSLSRSHSPRASQLLYIQ